ncbi:MAG: hypothetical protein AVDCRST_MAG12-3287, partial [uncultured Rubrobacteraceae bacterium]
GERRRRSELRALVRLPAEAAAGGLRGLLRGVPG